MEEIANAFASYAALLENLNWLKENGQLSPDADVGLLAFQGAIAYTSPVVIEAFAASMEIAKAASDRQANAPKRQRPVTGKKAMETHEALLQREREIYDKARQLSVELASRG